MKDPRAVSDRRDREWVPYIVFGLLLIIGTIGFGAYGAVAVFLSFFAGRASVEKRLPFIQPLADQRKEGKRVLEQVSRSDLQEIRELLERGQKGKAMARIRSLCSCGNRAAKNAAELLDEFGDKWTEVETNDE